MENENMVLNEIHPEELCFSNWLSLAFALFWRSIVTMLLSMLVAGIAGFLIGILIGLFSKIMGIDIAQYKIYISIVMFFMGFGIGFLFNIVLIKWVLKARFNNFRLAIVEYNKI